VDEAILGAYLAGANTRRIRKALAPRLGEEHLSTSAASRVAFEVREPPVMTTPSPRGRGGLSGPQTVGNAKLKARPETLASE
jgi:hypothetical protein